MPTKHWQRLAGFLLCIFIAVDLERIVEAAEWTCTSSPTPTSSNGAFSHSNSSTNSSANHPNISSTNSSTNSSANHQHSSSMNSSTNSSANHSGTGVGSGNHSGHGNRNNGGRRNLVGAHETSGVFNLFDDCQMSSEVVVTGTLQITGRSNLTWLKAAANSRHFKLDKVGSELVLKYLKLTGGDLKKSNNVIDSYGGSILIQNGVLRATSCWFYQNSACNGGAISIRNKEMQALWTAV